jgi:hypothetical protein
MKKEKGLDAWLSDYRQREKPGGGDPQSIFATNDTTFTGELQGKCFSPVEFIAFVAIFQIC